MLHKQSSGVGKYLKWVKEKLTGGNLPNINQQLQDMPCKKIHRCKVDPETRIVHRFTSLVTGHDLLCGERWLCAVLLNQYLLNTMFIFHGFL